VEKAYARYGKVAKTGGDKEAQRIVAVLDKVPPGARRGSACAQRAAVEGRAGGAEAFFPLDREAGDVTSPTSPSTDFKDNPLLAKVEEYAKKEGAPVVPISAAPRSADRRSPGRKTSRYFSPDMGMKEPGLNRLIRAGYTLLGLQTYFTAGPKEVRRPGPCKSGATAPQAAGVIHTDFERGFIRAEVTSFADYVAGNGEQGAKEAGS